MKLVLSDIQSLCEFSTDTGAGSHFGLPKGIKIQHFFRPFLRLYSLELWASKYTPFLDVRQAKVTSGISILQKTISSCVLRAFQRGTCMCRLVGAKRRNGNEQRKPSIGILMVEVVLKHENTPSKSPLRFYDYNLSI